MSISKKIARTAETIRGGIEQAGAKIKDASGH